MAVLALSNIGIPKANAASVLEINVDNIDDNNPTGGCTLREAIDVVNASLGPGLAPNGCTVNLSGADPPSTYIIILPSYIYTLSGVDGEDINRSGDLDIFASYSLTLAGAGAGNTIIDGGGIDRVLHIIVDGITINIGNLTIQNGYSQDGGGISLEGSEVTITNSEISDNYAFGDGGGIANHANLTIANSTISNNYANVDGGGIINHTKLTVANSIISDNYANVDGGGIKSDNYSSLTISNSDITSNYANSRGGGIGSTSANINNSNISNNTSGSNGGGIICFYSSGGSILNVFNSTIIGNNTRGNGGGISSCRYWTTNIANSTISNNYANNSAGGIYLSGPGIVNLTNLTITKNIADDDENGNGDGGGIYHSEGTFYLKNTILAGNNDTSGGGPDCSGTFSSLGYNLVGINTGCLASFPSGNPNSKNDFVGTDAFPMDPILGPLTGDPAYFLLQLDSPAIDKIPEANCTYKSEGTNPLFTNDSSITNDQAGYTRDLHCDIGAFEVPPVGVQVLEGETDIPNNTGEVNFGTTLVGTPLLKTFTVKNIGKSFDLILSNLMVPSGFQIASDFGNTNVASNSQTTFVIQLDVAEAQTYAGELSFTNNATIQNPFNFNIQGSIVSEKFIHLPVIPKHLGGWENENKLLLDP